MAGEMCPNCGTLLTTSLKFCVNCRRTVTEDKIKITGSRAVREEAGKFKLSRGSSYDEIRQLRAVCTTLTTLLCIVSVYYFVMKFVIHQPIPFEEQITSAVEQIKQQQSAGKTQP